MKCIKLSDGTVKRLPDFQAAMLVDAKVATYCGKEEWKKSARKDAKK